MRPFTTDYSDRQVDVEAMQSISTPAGVTPLAFTLGPTSRIIAGMQKLAQRYTILLLTTLTDVHYDQAAGTSFLVDMYRGAAQNPGRLNFVFAFASSDVLAQMREEDAQTAIYGDIPADERIANATLEEWSVDYTTGTLYLRVLLTNIEGDEYVYILPATVVRS